MVYLLMQFIQTLSTVLIILVIVDVVLSYFLSPYHPVRSWLDRITEPLLMPIRRVVPPIAGFDFSPIILILLIQAVEWVLLTILALLR